MKKILLVLIIFSLFGCKAKKVFIETHSTDTIYKSEILKITPAGVNGLKIKSPCDSLGNLKPFDYSFESGKNKVNIKGADKVISLNVASDSIIEKDTKEKTTSDKTSVKKEIVYRTPEYIWKFIIAMLITIFLETLYIIKKPF